MKSLWDALQLHRFPYSKAPKTSTKSDSQGVKAYSLLGVALTRRKILASMRVYIHTIPMETSRSQKMEAQKVYDPYPLL